VNSLPKTVTRQCHSFDMNPGPCAPESSTLTTWLPSHPITLGCIKSGPSGFAFNLFKRRSRRAVAAVTKKADYIG